MNVDVDKFRDTEHSSTWYTPTLLYYSVNAEIERIVCSCPCQRNEGMHEEQRHTSTYPYPPR
jgi:hypothetical protein